MRYLTVFDGQTFRCINLTELNKSESEVAQYIDSVKACKIPYAVTEKTQSETTVIESLDYEIVAAVANISYGILERGGEFWVEPTKPPSSSNQPPSA